MVLSLSNHKATASVRTQQATRRLIQCGLFLCYGGDTYSKLCPRVHAAPATGLSCLWFQQSIVFPMIRVVWGTTVINSVQLLHEQAKGIWQNFESSGQNTRLLAIQIDQYNITCIDWLCTQSLACFHLDFIQ